MPVLFLIDGLTADGDPPFGSLCPHLDGMAAHGDTGRVRLIQKGQVPEESMAWFSLFGRAGFFPKETDPPLGYLSALGLGLNPDPSRIWARLSFTHVYRKQDKLIFMSPNRTGQSPGECQILASGMKEDLAVMGWKLHLTNPDSLCILVSSDQPIQARTSMLDRLEGESLLDFIPRSSSGGKGLTNLLTNAQMLLKPHPVNLEREAEGRFPLNLAWFWGMSDGRNFPSKSPIKSARNICWTHDPVVMGLAVASNFGIGMLPVDAHGFDYLVENIVKQAKEGQVVVHIQSPATLARHGMNDERLARLKQIDQELIAPIANALQSSGNRLVVAGSYHLSERGLGLGDPTSWLSTSGPSLTKTRRVWNRRQFGQGRLIDASVFRKRWLA
ncbi:MAG: hypothetical protein HQL54_13005 [Magnetococcales bacterium]|nr:hypothetical protein [Magnetococcales bacterium]